MFTNCSTDFYLPFIVRNNRTNTSKALFRIKYNLKYLKYQITMLPCFRQGEFVFFFPLKSENNKIKNFE